MAKFLSSGQSAWLSTKTLNCLAHLLDAPVILMRLLLQNQNAQSTQQVCLVYSYNRFERKGSQRGRSQMNLFRINLFKWPDQ